MKNVKPLPPLDELAACYRVNPACESGLERIGSPTRKGGKLGPTGGIGSDGYWRVTHRGSSYRVHRVIWALTNKADPGKLIIDHRDGDPMNNSPDNLRACTAAENQQNKKSPKRKEGVSVGLPKGVRRKGDVYVFSIMVSGERHVAELNNLKAARAYARQVRDQLHGEFSRHN